MTVPYTFDDFLTTIRSHKTQVQSHQYVMQHQKLVAVLFDHLLGESPSRQNVIALFSRNNYTLDQRLADTIATLVNNLRKNRAKNAKVH